MSQNSDPEKIVRAIKRKTRRLFSAEEKIRFVHEARTRRLMGDTKREATSGDVTEPRHENGHLKELVAQGEVLQDELEAGLGVRIKRELDDCEQGVVRYSQCRNGNGARRTGFSGGTGWRGGSWGY